MSDAPALKSTSLARIRDNQRRSRVRRKEYLHKLETKLRAYKQTGVEAAAGGHGLLSDAASVWRGTRALSISLFPTRC
ncbi:uncharacterized protein BDZ99DRAFT_468851 [Mytilinidion resinicola]|uniref:BZIP domain-containing protein n=1 Tax=Mytilinidion resinicola TaxID=574789 RepID=A0A6A6Y3S3_9PEZI|nr:uncharacterized protein BDZ99DRAFT_468851 [Mytilinidion resinicola]KAF2802674.1 hypothetical protein BDZ99DRAFT_468851 [Mytilinidion resinicola]